MKEQPLSTRREKGVAVITMDNPPVNALSFALRERLDAALRELAADPAVQAIVLTGTGRGFCAGADITEFGKAPRSPKTIEIIETIESCPKPVLAALHGQTLGGGLELALACHERTAAPGTRLALPEVKLGLIPGAGGTQRLPRVIGATAALEMIVNASALGSAEARDVGLVAEVADDPVAAAMEFARDLAARGAELPRTRDRTSSDDRQAFEAKAESLLRRARGAEAVAAAVEAVRWSLELPFDEALQREQEAFQRLRDGQQSKAMRHLFFAERAATKVPDVDLRRAQSVNRAAVIGAGTMGVGISMSFADAGIPVTLVETSTESLERGLGNVRKLYASAHSRGRLDEADMKSRLSLIHGTTDLGAVGDADLIIEAVFEDLGVKQGLFARLDEIAKPGAVLASNTSYLNIDKIADATTRPDAVIGTHFFSPAHVMRLLEIVRGRRTGTNTIATVIAAAQRLNKQPVVVGDCPGFVGNRILRQRHEQGEQLLLEGALPEQVDRAVMRFGFPMGPFAMLDMAGLDVGYRIRRSQGYDLAIADAICERGWLGQKTGRGFYSYREGARTPLPDPEVEQLIVATSKRLGITRRSIGDDEIVERLLFPMANEGARILEEGIARRASDIDVIMSTATAFPPGAAV
ncbi:MAG: enoyl-CoA hydratase/isomerase family protein [Ectothiorhodospiraceae bacterium]|nr:enoyl-CoA hydratase/isomerase family protein [Ectothiorhodospiraceae bacterium]